MAKSDFLFSIKDEKRLIFFYSPASLISFYFFELHILILRYIAYCRETCAPRLSDTAGEKLVHSYVRMRNPPVDPAQKR